MTSSPETASGEGKLPGFLPGGKFFTLTDFKGINTKSPRMSIEDEEFSWCENLFPIGKGNLRTLWGKGTSKYTAAGGRSVVMTFFYHIGNTGYGIVILDNGTAIQFNTSSGATTTISATPNTFYNGGSLPVMVAWNGSGVLMLSSTASNGYYAWDPNASTLYAAGSAAPTWLSGLTSNPTHVGSTHTSTVVDGLDSTTNIQVGMTITGTDIPANTTVATITSTTAITISQAATGSHSSITFTFSWVMPSGLSGTSMEIFQNRVWIGNGGTVSFSAASNGTAFSTSAGGGSFTFTDSFMQTVNALRQANGYLYVFGDSGINYIGNVQSTVNTTTGTVTTTFNNLNTDPQVGTPWSNSVVPFGRALMLANTTGVYAMFGGSAEKVSDKLDGLFSSATLPLTGLTNMPSGAVASIFNIRCFFLLVTAVDPFTGSSRPIMCVWDGNKWYIASQEVNCTYIATAETNSQLVAWGTDGTNVFPMFQTASVTLTKKFKSRLWPGRSYLIDKMAINLYFELVDNSGNGFTVTGSIDSELNSIPLSFQSTPGLLTFINSVLGTLQFQSTNGNINFSVAALPIQAASVDSSFGKLLGITLSSVSKDFTLVESSILYKDYHFFG